MQPWFRNETLEAFTDGKTAMGEEGDEKAKKIWPKALPNAIAFGLKFYSV